MALAPEVVLADITTGLQVRYWFDEATGPSAADSSGNHRTGTVAGGGLITAVGRFGGGVHLDGMNDYIDCPPISATDGASALTVAFWLNTDTRGEFDILCSKYQTDDYLFTVQIGSSGIAGTDDLIVYIHNSTKPNYVYTTGNVLSEGTWLHVAVVYDGSQVGNTDKCKIYINGQLAARAAVGTIPATLYSNASDHWYLGWRDDQPTGYALDGKIDAFNLYNRPLSASDVAELHRHSPPIAVVNPGYTSVTQHVVPRFGAGASYPAGQLVGSGPPSVIRATAATELLPAGADALVITQDYDVANMSQWQNGTYQQPGYAAAVLQPVIRNLTIAGYDPTGNNYADNGSDVNSNPWVQDLLKEQKYDLLRVRANGAEVRNVQLFACPGTAMVITRDVNKLNGQVREFDREINIVSHVCFNRVFSGIDVRSVDHQVEHIEGTRWRDFGVKVSHHHELHDIHVYGGGDYGIWLEGDGNQLTNSYPENVFFGKQNDAFGLYVQGSQNVIQSLRSHSCAEANVWLAGSGNVLDGFWLSDWFRDIQAGETNPLGILLGGQENTVVHGRIDLEAGETGIRITHGERHTIGDIVLGAYQESTTTGIDADATLNNCKIDVLFVGGGVGLDLHDLVESTSISRLGVANDIIIQASWLGPTSELIDLPPTWDKSNTIVANGMRIKGSVTNIVNGDPTTTITAPAHGLTGTALVAIGGALGGTNVNSAVGTYHTATVVDANTFTIQLVGSGGYTAGTGWWGEWITK
jgi:hypothetical protein